MPAKAAQPMIETIMPSAGGHAVARPVQGVAKQQEGVGTRRENNHERDTGETKKGGERHANHY